MNEIYIKPDLKNAQRRSKDETIIDRSLFNIPDEYKQLGYNKKYYLRTYGCQANERDSETIRGILELMSYTEVKEPESADIIIMNTCAIRKNAENHVFGEIGQLKRLKYINPDLMFVVCGCMAQEEEVVETILKKYHHIDIIFGTHNIHRFPELLIQAHFNKERVVEVYSKEGEIYENLPVIRQQNTKAWVNIIYGCDKFCTYCIVPYTRGKERSRLKEDILDEINSLIKDGYKEVTLLGQNVNAYGKDLTDDYLFAELLEDVARTSIERIRFMTSHPWDFTDKMVDIIAKYDNIMPFVHLPLQSGNNEILRLMGRRYTTDDYLHVFNRLKEKVSNVSFSTDIIVGFPNETEEQFEETLKIMDYCQFDNVYTFIYSPRSGTPASRMDDNVNLETKRNRLKLLNQKVAQYALQNNKKLVGSIQNVLVDGPSKRDINVYSGYTEGNKLVNFIPKNAKTGMIVQVRITNVNTWTLKGDEISI
jgi:tRNA-2-methylthio-N6-dimethylallyladenosine synthase